MADKEATQTSNEPIWDNKKPWHENIARAIHHITKAPDEDETYNRTYKFLANNGHELNAANDFADQYARQRVIHGMPLQMAGDLATGIIHRYATPDDWREGASNAAFDALTGLTGTAGVAAAPLSLVSTPANSGEDEVARQMRMGLRQSPQGMAETPVAEDKSKGYDDGGAVDRRKMSHKDVTQRIHELTVAAQKLGSDEMSSEKYQELINRHKPVYPWDHVPTPATKEEMLSALKESQRRNIGQAHTIPQGHKVGLRLDIPAYKDHGVWVPTIHDRSGDKQPVIAHEPAAHISNAKFTIPEGKALAVAKGVNKSPFATIDGSWNKTPVEDIHAMAHKYLNHPDWSQVGMDPERHSYFYNRKTQEPITNADEVMQVGPLVLAKNARSEKAKKDFSYEQGGTVDAALKIARDRTKSSAKWGQNKSLEFGDLAKILEDVRSTKLGRTIQRYQTPEAGEATQTMYKDLLGLAKEGTPGRKWYEKSSKRILDYVGGNKNEADKFAQLIAIYSPQTTVPVNTSNAIKAYNRSKVGHKIWNGDIVDREKTFDKIADVTKYINSLGGSKAGFTKIPLDDTNKRYLIARHDPKSYDNIATADRDLKAHLVMNEGIPFEGRKTNNFYNNLMVHIDPHRLQGSTQDLWMAKAFGFHDPAIASGAKYDFMERLTEKLSKELNWKPHQVQAAIWTAMKTRQESIANDAKKEAIKQGLAKLVSGPKGKDKFVINEGNEDKFSELLRDMAMKAPISRKKIKESSKDFSDFLDQNLAHITWESAPSKRIAHLQGLEDLPPEARAEYHGLMSRAMHDDKGNDLLAKHLGIMTPGSVDAPGYWEEKSNPASHVKVASTRIKGAEQRPDIDEPSKELLNIYANAKGLLHKQDGVGYHRPFFNPKISEANGVEYNFDKDLTPDHVIGIGKALDAHTSGSGLIPVSPRTVRVINFGNNYPDQRDFHKAVDNVMSTSVPDTHTAIKRAFASDGDLVGNDWEINKNGEDYRQRLSASKRPDVLKFISTVLAPRVEAVDREFAQKHGLQTDPQLESSLRSLDTQGPSGTQGLNQFNQGGRVGYADGGAPDINDPNSPEEKLKKLVAGNTMGLDGTSGNITPGYTKSDTTPNTANQNTGNGIFGGIFGGGAPTVVDTKSNDLNPYNNSNYQPGAVQSIALAAPATNQTAATRGITIADEEEVPANLVSTPTQTAVATTPTANVNVATATPSQMFTDSGKISSRAGEELPGYVGSARSAFVDESKALAAAYGNLSDTFAANQTATPTAAEVGQSLPGAVTGQNLVGSFDPLASQDVLGDVSHGTFGFSGPIGLSNAIQETQDQIDQQQEETPESAPEETTTNDAPENDAPTGDAPAGDGPEGERRGGFIHPHHRHRMPLFAHGGYVYDDLIRHALRVAHQFGPDAAQRAVQIALQQAGRR